MLDGEVDTAPDDDAVVAPVAEVDAEAAEEEAGGEAGGEAAGAEEREGAEDRIRKSISEDALVAAWTKEEASSAVPSPEPVVLIESLVRSHSAMTNMDL